MPNLNPYEDIDPLAFASVATRFDFRASSLGVVDFPASFVRDYIHAIRHADLLDESKAIFWPQTLGHGILIFERVLSPGEIFATNRKLNESVYGDAGPVIPLGHVVVVECYDDAGKVFLTVQLGPDTPDHGRIHFWRRAYDSYGTGDNATPPIYTARSLGAFFSGLVTEDEAIVRLASAR